jgi:hypothetical protein
MTIPVAICLISLVALMDLLRRDRMSLGLPLAYLGSLLLIHVPGAFIHAVDPGFLYGSRWTQIGIDYSAVGAVAFVGGTWLARRRANGRTLYRPSIQEHRFALLCLVGGWGFVYGLSPLHSIPSIGAMIGKAGAVWMLGVILGLRTATRYGDLKLMIFWVGTLAIYPTVTLLIGGFLSYGVAASIVVLSAIVIVTRSHAQAMCGIALASYFGLSLFVTYYGHRDSIRDNVWGGASLADRVSGVEAMFTDFQFFNPKVDNQASAINERLNQNYFVGLAADRIAHGEANYLYGRSIWESIEALIPRILWPNKPVEAGSADIVSKMTGLRFSTDTSFGVGNVMEFEINFGLPGVVLGFFGLGWILGKLDRKTFEAVNRGEFGRAVIYFVPTVALINPQGSMVEMASGSAAALLGAYAWKLIWESLKSSNHFLRVRGQRRFWPPDVLVTRGLVDNRVA